MAVWATEMAKRRCPWGEANDLYSAYHDREWGVPVRDDRTLFQFLILEGAQAGLSWATILKKRDGYRRAFAGFDPVKVAAFGEEEVSRLGSDPGIVRNLAKIRAAIQNARGVLEIRREAGSLALYLWSFVGGRPQQHEFGSLADIPAHTSESEEMSSDLRRRGFLFVGPTVCYAFMQAVGMVNDHLVSCFRHHEVREAAADFEDWYSPGRGGAAGITYK